MKSSEVVFTSTPADTSTSHTTRAIPAGRSTAAPGKSSHASCSSPTAATRAGDRATDVIIIEDIQPNGSIDTPTTLVATMLPVNVDTPSSTYEETICQQLEELVETSQSTWRTSMRMFRVLFFSFIFKQNWAVLATSMMLIISCIIEPLASTYLCTCLFFILYALCTLLQAYLMWQRVTETRYHTADIIRAVVARWRRRIDVMREQDSQTPEERREVFLECFANIPAKAFRFLAIVDERTFRLKHILKCLVVKRSKRLDEVTLSVRRYMEPQSICKLIDVARIMLESGAIVLKPLTDRARPPRLPNLLMSCRRFVEEDATTDESDNEHEPRASTNRGNCAPVSEQMEFFVHRVFLLLWIIAMVLTIGAGFLYYFLVKAPLGEGVFLDPSVALLGLLPVNAVVINRLLVLYANIYLDKLFHYMVCKRMHNVDDRLPRFKFIETLKTMYRVVMHIQPKNGSRNPQLFSTSLVDTFGVASVVAMLDQQGVVTDMVLVPKQILLFKPRGASADNSSSEEDDEGQGTNGNNSINNTNTVIADGNNTNTTTSKDSSGARERQREMKRQVKRKKFQEERFLELQLRPSSHDELAVEFAEHKEVLSSHRGHLQPLCLCIVLHAAAKLPANVETWTERFRFCDSTEKWFRSLHWIPRAFNFSDNISNGFLILARIFQIDTKVNTGYHNTTPEQTCSLLVEDTTGLLHVFTMGTPYLVSQCCSTIWTGGNVDEYDTKEKKELLFMAKHQWEDGMCLETVALSHRVLPERYRPYVNTLPRNPGQYSEFFFQDGLPVTHETARKRSSRKSRAPGRFGEDDLLSSQSQREISRPFQLEEEEMWRTKADDERRRHGRHRRCKSAAALFEPSKAFRAPPLPRRAASVGCQPYLQPEKDDYLTPQTFIQQMASTSQTFLGLVGLRDSVRPNVQHAMSVLEDAGVRCMYFCSGTEKQTKSFGGRVGLETDWNCCISLKEDAVALDPYSIRAQLPFGIKSIRKHILHVDAIPLQVHLFSHAQGVSTRAMLSILQDNHEVVVAVGSVFNHSNVRSFVQADLAIGVLPTRRGANAEKEAVLKHHSIVEPSDFSATDSLNRDIPLYRNVAELLSCACTLQAPPTTSILPIIVTMVRQARMRISGINNCAEFIMHANVLVVTINSASLVVGAPLLMTPTMTVFILNGIIPILALSCTYTAYSSLDPMKTMHSRHNYFVRLAIFRHSTVVWCLRYVPSVIALVTLGITASTHTCHVSVLNLFSKTSDNCLASAQGYVALTFNYWLMVHCWTHISRHHPISLSFSLRLGHGKRSTNLFLSYRWVGISFLVSVLSVVLVLLDTPTAALGQAFFPSPVHFVLSLLFPFVLLGLDWPIKRWRERRFNNMQKFRKLSFGTRLGMHSPRGDYEPEGVQYTSSGGAGEGGEGSENRKRGIGKRIDEALYQYTTMRGGKLELNCVCCDHIGGNYASYHVSANV